MKKSAALDLVLPVWYTDYLLLMMLLQLLSVFYCCCMLLLPSREGDVFIGVGLFVGWFVC